MGDAPIVGAALDIFPRFLGVRRRREGGPEVFDSDWTGRVGTVNPFPNVTRHMKRAKRAFASGDGVNGRRAGGGKRIFFRDDEVGSKIVAPRVISAVGAARRFLPLGFGGELFSCPFAESLGFVERYVNNGDVGYASGSRKADASGEFGIGLVRNFRAIDRKSGEFDGDLTGSGQVGTGGNGEYGAALHGLRLLRLGLLGIPLATLRVVKPAGESCGEEDDGGASDGENGD